MYFDAHTHLHFSAFEKDWKEVIDRALRAKVWLVNVGTQKDTSQRAVEIAHEYGRGVYAAVGLHPIHTGASFHDAQELGGGGSAEKGFVSRGEVFDYDFYKKLARDPKVVAIGECGLDYYRLEQDSKGKQRNAFETQIELSREIGKPLMIHCRDAFGDLIEVFKAKFNILNDPPGIIHFFGGTVDDAKALLSMGFYFTFGGVITFTRDYDEAVKYIPRDRILSETDAPYVTPEPYRGKRNESAYVIYVVKKLADIRGVSWEEIEHQTFENAKKIFKL